MIGLRYLLRCVDDVVYNIGSRLIIYRSGPLVLRNEMVFFCTVTIFVATDNRGESNSVNVSVICPRSLSRRMPSVCRGFVSVSFRFLRQHGGTSVIHPVNEYARPFFGRFRDNAAAWSTFNYSQTFGQLLRTSEKFPIGIDFIFF